MAYNQRAKPTPRATNEPLTTEAQGERNKMSGLNDQLAHYIQNVRDMKVASARALGQTHYYQTLEKMENEIVKIRNTYDYQMERMRKEVEHTNSKNIALLQAMQRDRQRLDEFEKRLAEDNSVIAKSKDYQGEMRTHLSQREADVMRMRAELQSRENELKDVRTKNNNLMLNVDDLLIKLESEKKRRMETEDKVAQLQESSQFQRQVHSQKEEDLQDRIKIANGIIQSLDDKLEELARMTHEQLPKMMKRMRDATTTEMREFHADTEDRLGKTIDSLRRQMAEEQKGKTRVEQERETLKKVTISQEESHKDLLGQNQALRDQVAALKKELQAERQRSRDEAREQGRIIHKLEDDLMDKAKEFVRAREAQATLRAEIESYKSMLLEENSRIQGNPGSLSERGPQPARQAPMGRHDTQSVPPPRHMNPQPKIPPIQAQSNMAGILEPHDGNPYLDQRNHWPGYDTTYGRSYIPKPHDRYGKPFQYG